MRVTIKQATVATAASNQRVKIMTEAVALSCLSEEEEEEPEQLTCASDNFQARPTSSARHRLAEDSCDYLYSLLPKHRRGVSAAHWCRTSGQGFSDEMASNPSIGSVLSNQLLSLSNSAQQQQKLLLQHLLDANNSGAGIDMLNMPSTAETLARQRSWMQIYFRYRVPWYEAKPFLEKMSREEAYKPENLNLWTRYVKVSQHRKVPFIHAVRAFRNRMRVPSVQMRYTLNSFYRKGSERIIAKNAGSLHPIGLPQFRCPDDLPELKKMAVAVVNVFVTVDDTYFDDFWKECGSV